MSGNLLQLAKRDAKRIVTSGGFQESIEISTPTKDLTLSLTGFATKHHLGFDTDGMPVNTKNVHVTVDESILILNNYPVRNAKGEVSLLKHIVAFPDSTGVVRTYIVTETFPDEVLGLITLILGDFKP